MRMRRNLRPWRELERGTRGTFPAPPGAGRREGGSYPSINRTSPARGPFVESSAENSTRCPSRRSSKTAPRTELRWKKCSMPPSSRMKPNPLSMRRRAIVPVGIAVSSDARKPRTIPGASGPLDQRTYEARRKRRPRTRSGVSSASVGSAATEVKESPNPLRMCHLVGFRWYAAQG